MKHDLEQVLRREPPIADWSDPFWIEFFAKLGVAGELVRSFTLTVTAAERPMLTLEYWSDKPSLLDRNLIEHITYQLVPLSGGVR